MRTTWLLAIGLVFFAFALLGMAYLSLAERPEEIKITEEQVPASTLQPPTRTFTPTLRPTGTALPSPTLSSTPTGTSTRKPPIIGIEPTATEAVNCVPPVGWITSFVQPRNTLFSIALETGVSVQELMSANCLNETTIFAGQQLYVPPSISETPQPYVPPSISETPVPIEPTPSPQPYVVEAEWPARMETKLSGTIRVSLIRTRDGYVPTVEIQGNTAVVSTPIPFGTPDVEPLLAFGNEYHAYAVAYIIGTSFNVEPALQEPQSLDQERVDWIWSIRSDDPGKQGLDVYIEIEWRPVDNTGESLTRRIWRNHIDIEVVQPLISRGEISIFSLASGFIGSGLSIPWVYELLSKRRTKKQRTTKKQE